MGQASNPRLGGAQKTALREAYNRLTGRDPATVRALTHNRDGFEAVCEKLYRAAGNVLRAKRLPCHVPNQERLLRGGVSVGHVLMEAGYDLAGDGPLRHRRSVICAPVADLPGGTP